MQGPWQVNQQPLLPSRADLLANVMGGGEKYLCSIRRTELGDLFSWERERLFIRGPLKMQARAGSALVVMLAMALGRVWEKRAGQVRSLVRAA